MAEAHSAVAFSFTVTHEGVDVNLNHEALRAVWSSGKRSWKKRLGRAKNKLKAGTYPGSIQSLGVVMALVTAVRFAFSDPSFGIAAVLEAFFTPSNVPFMVYELMACALLGFLVWLCAILFLKYTLKMLLMYQGWMYEERGKVSMQTKLWLGLIRLFGGRKPMLNSYQSSMPKLVLPSVADTMKRYLLSIQPLVDEEKYNRMATLAHEFEQGIGNKLQRYLLLKSWWSTNYVTDWWEEYVYLRGRSAIMVNSNYYGVDVVRQHPSGRQASRAGNVVYVMLKYRRDLDREELNPILLNKTVPLCSAQYERQFNSTRIPGIETDKLVHLKSSSHVAVYHKGRFYKVYIHFKGRYLTPCELESSFQKILDDESEPVPGEENLAALTAADRVPWAKARAQFFSKGKNKASLDAIEKAAFFLSFDDEPQHFTQEIPETFDKYAKAMLHGKGNNRWFDKSFTLVVCSNGRIGFNAEHSWADAPIMAHLWEHCAALDADLGADAPIMAHLWEYAVTADHFDLGYETGGYTKGKPEMTPPNPIRLEWDLPEACIEVIDQSYETAQQILNDVDLHMLVHDQFGKGLMKKCKTSPDAFIQMSLQLAYFRDAGKFDLTYESSMTRLFREGRTETVRPCTLEATQFVKAMEDTTKTKEEKIAAFKKATDRHQMMYRDAMTGKGIDRHLFCLYVVSKYLEIDNQFLNEVLSEPWRLSTSQTPHQQTDKLDLVKYPDRISGGGGFGPVADDGYGVSYIIAGEDVLFFHISSKVSCPATDSHRFGKAISDALDDIKSLFSVSQ